jgi:hypothetical protein
MVWNDLPKNSLIKLNAHMKERLNVPEAEATGDKNSNRKSKPVPTSYSLRRLAIQRFIATHTDGEGNVNWERVIELSGHLNKEMPQHIYSKTAMEIASSERFLCGDEKGEPEDIVVLSDGDDSDDGDDAEVSVKVEESPVEL